MRVSFYTTLAIPAALLLGAGVSNAYQQQTYERERTVTTDSASRPDADVTYGRIKEFKAGQKVVIDLDNAPDKSFDLTGRDNQISLGANLKVGDPVKITERTTSGQKNVDIAMDTQSGMKHGDKSQSEERTGSADRAAPEDQPDVTWGRVKELTAGKKVVVQVDNAPDKSYDLTDKDAAVALSAGLAVGDQVKVTEHKIAGKNHVEITKGTPSSADRQKQY